MTDESERRGVCVCVLSSAAAPTALIGQCVCTVYTVYTVYTVKMLKKTFLSLGEASLFR